MVFVLNPAQAGNHFGARGTAGVAGGIFAGGLRPGSRGDVQGNTGAVIFILPPCILGVAWAQYTWTTVCDTVFSFS